MANETLICVVGNLTADPELRFTNSGTAVASFTVASTPRVFDKQSGEYKDGDALFLRASVWREFAEHVVASLKKGTRVIVQGNLRQRSYETREGEKRTSYELDVQEIGPSLRYATAEVARASQNGTASGSGWETPAHTSAGNSSPAQGDIDGWNVPIGQSTDTPF